MDISNNEKQIEIHTNGRTITMKKKCNINLKAIIKMNLIANNTIKTEDEDLAEAIFGKGILTIKI